MKIIPAQLQTNYDSYVPRAGMRVKQDASGGVLTTLAAIVKNVIYLTYLFHYSDEIWSAYKSQSHRRANSSNLLASLLLELITRN